jgi:hypothetical protein
MRIPYGLLAATALFAFAAPAAAGKGATLGAGGLTIAGPATVTVSAGGTTEVFFHSGSGAPDACVTVVNTGRVPVQAEIAGATVPVMFVPVGATHAQCLQDLTGIEFQCPQEQACAAQWRVDRN